MENYREQTKPVEERERKGKVFELVGKDGASDPVRNATLA